MADSYEINLEIQGGEQPALVMETEGGATDGASARNAEAWANGTRNGVPVTEGDPAYHNNSKYYRDSAAAIVAGDIIDDDAGIGDYDLTWSADKLVGEFEGKATAIGVTDTESAAVKTFSDGSDGMPMGVTVGIEPVQAGSGDPSPSNVRAISGWTGIKIRNYSKCILGGEALRDAIKAHIPSAEIDTTNKTITFAANAATTEGCPIIGDSPTYPSFFPFKENTSYTFVLTGYNTNTATRTANLRMRYSNDTYANLDFGTAGTKSTNVQVSVDTKTLARIYKTNQSSSTVLYYEESGIFEGVLTVDDFVPYDGQTYEISIPSTPGTVYGGSLTVNKDGTGKLVVNKSKWTVPRSISSSYLVYSSTRGVGVRYTGTTHMKKGSDNSRALCNFTDICMPYNTIYMSTQNWTFFKGSWTSTSEFMEVIEEMYQNETTPEFVWLLDTPVEYTLTASQVNALITSLKGVNYIYADSGNILSVDYSADTKLYVDEHNEAEDTAITAIHGMIADSDAHVATASHAIGDVFICGNELLRATSVIVSGETISTGTGGNAEVLNLANYIAEVIASVSTARTAIVDGDTAVYNWINPMMVLTKTNIGGDQEVTNSYRKVTRTGNHITFERTGNSTTSVHFNMTGAIEKYVDKDISQYITLPDLTGARLFLVLKYNCHSYSGSAASPFSYHVRTWDKNAEHDVDVASISPDGTTVSSVIASNGICTIDIDSVLPNARANKNLNVSFFSRRSDMEAEFDLNIIAMPVTQTT